MEVALASGEFGTGFVQTYRALPASVAAIRSAFDQFARDAGAPRATADAIALAVSEAATNVVIHAYRDRTEPGEVEVIGAVEADELVVIVRDSGSGLRPRRDSPGLGLGLAIIAQACDRLDLLASAAGGVEVRMHFGLLGTRP